MHDDQDAVLCILDIHLDGRIAETRGHRDTGKAVLGYQSVQVAAAVGIDLGEFVGCRTAGGKQSR